MTARRARQAAALAALLAAAGDRAEAERWLAVAESAARDGPLPDVLSSALRTRGELAAASGDEAAAEEHFTAAQAVTETEARQFRHGADAAAYTAARPLAVRHLLRAAARRGDAAAAFRHQEVDRGRLLVELWRPAGRAARVGPPDLPDLDAAIDRCEPTAADLPALLARRDRLLSDWLRSGSRRDTAAVPAVPTVEAVVAALPLGAVYLAATLVGDDLVTVTIARGQGARVDVRPGAAGVRRAVAGFRAAVAEQMAAYCGGRPPGPADQAALNGHLAALGSGPLGAAVAAAGPARRLVWVPDAELHGLPAAAVRIDGKYLAERLAAVTLPSGGLLVRLRRSRKRRGGPLLAVAEGADVLPEAGAEADGAAAAFGRGRRLVGPLASRAVVRRLLGRAGAVHFACHGEFDPTRPLAAAVRLPTGEPWRALDWLDAPAAGLPLAVLSACRSAEAARQAGGEPFGLAAGALAGGVRAVVAGLWPVADAAARPLMWAFHRARLTTDLAAGLAAAQREQLGGPFGSPLFWAAFALYGDADALPAPPAWARWWRRWRQRRHARRFPTDSP